MGINNECQLFRGITIAFLASKIERNVYNRRKREPLPYI